MVDVSKLGVSVDTSEVKEGTADLHKFGEEGSKAANKTSALSKVMSDVARVFSIVGVSIAKSNLALVQATEGATREQVKLAQSAVKVAEGGYKESLALKELAKEQNEVRKSASALRKEKEKQITAGDRSAAQANRFNTGNIAAQFQDIFVTAQMGMNPLTIALQQGTQLVYILQQTKNPLKDLLAGLKNLISPLTLIVVLLTGFLAKYIQTVDWIDVGKRSLNSLANGFDFLADNVKVLSAVFAVTFAGLIGHLLKSITLIESLKKAFKAVKTVAVAVSGAIFNAWVLIPVLIVGFVEAIGLFPEQAKKVANAIIKIFTDMVNQIIGMFVAVSEGVGIIIAGGVSGIISGSLDEGWKTIKDTFSETLDEEYIKAKPIMTGVGAFIDNTSDLVNTVNSSVGGFLNNTADKLRTTAEGLKKKDKDAKKLQKEIDKINKSYEGIFTKKADEFEKLQFEDSLEGLDVYEKTYRSVIYDMTKEVDNLRKTAIEAGVPLSKINEMFASAPGKIEAMALAEAEYKAQIEQVRAEEELYNAVVDYGASITKGFFADMKEGLKEGESIWESFTNSLLNMLDKIQDKMMDLAIDAAFDSMKSGNTGSNSWLGSLINTGMSIFTGGMSGGNSTSGAFAAMGGQMGVKPAMAANGGVFSNGIYSSPTLFKFAKGGKFGVMGEAGPEAVMPLRRSPDGSLGVRADGGGSPVVVNVINNSNAQARTERRQTAQGTEIDVLIDEMVGEKIGRPGTSSNNALRAYNNRQLIMR